jgi:hypothetical protein
MFFKIKTEVTRTAPLKGSITGTRKFENIKKNKNHPSDIFGKSGF